MKHHVTARVGDVSCSHGDNYVSIEFEDVISGITFMDIKLSYAQFGKLIGSNGSVRMEADIFGVENLGKKHITEARSIVCNESFGHLHYSEQQKAKEAWLLEHGKEDGWRVQPYLGGQSSIVRNFKDGTETFNYHVFKYVDISDEERVELLAKRDYY